VNLEQAPAFRPGSREVHCGFKAGFFNAFGIQWVGSKTFAFFFKVSEAEAKEVAIPITKYDSPWKQAMYYIEPGKTNPLCLISVVRPKEK
jgi:hypothetical protein